MTGDSEVLASSRGGYPLLHPEPGQQLEQTLAREADLAGGLRAAAAGTRECHFQEPPLELRACVGETSRGDGRRAGDDRRELCRPDQAACRRGDGERGDDVL